MPLARRKKETAEHIVRLPVYQAMKLIIKRHVNAQDFANHGAAGAQAPDQSRLSADKSMYPLQRRLPPARRHA